MPNKKREMIMSVLESIVASIQNNKEKINDLNVFPVPDGDTGSNMLATLMSAWNNISDASTTDIEVLKDFSRGALLGARGNSGVITSQIIKGFSEGVKKIGGLSSDINDLRVILRSTKEFAYKAVSNPVEGTILSVVKALDEKYERESTDLISAFEHMAVIAHTATDFTPEQLPVLKEAGVVDSGAYGLALIIDGVILALKGEALKINEISTNTTNEEEFRKADAFKNIGYCTEFIMTLKNPEAFDVEDFKKHLVDELKGDSLVIIKEEDILKVHIHAKKPGTIFNFAQEHGEFSKIKSENMATQAEDAGHWVEGEKFTTSKKLHHHELAIVAVSNGNGLDEEFRKAGVNHIVSGGQSMNPSVEEFVKLINDLHYKNIVLLPNNSNIILTAETAKEMIEDKNVFVLPTKTLQQGLVAVYNINKEMYDFHEYQDTVKEAFENVIEGQITIAVRDTEMNDIEVKKGEFISIKGKEIISSTKTIEESAKILISKIIENENCEVLTIIYNDDVKTEQIDALVEYAKNKNSDIEIEVIYGGQAVYHLLIFGEE
ncbi:MAG: phosphatase [Candidatus Tyloplasma litorale]|nr:MAG: phosphatase [Mycoplasmatales bacterium]